MIGAFCATCAFFSPSRMPGSRVGQCRFSAPVLDRDEAGRVRTIWPITDVTSWCGRHAVYEGNVE